MDRQSLKLCGPSTGQTDAMTSQSCVLSLGHASGLHCVFCIWKILTFGLVGASIGLRGIGVLLRSFS
jgi:hypothetical protein